MGKHARVPSLQGVLGLIVSQESELPIHDPVSGLTDWVSKGIRTQFAAGRASTSASISTKTSTKTSTKYQAPSTKTKTKTLQDQDHSKH
ncbi:hypothetical protein G7Z17_g12571 [Cylindrodendrum hubeiense]|uniref:Uncharacterized protein n=1 Tax=Cylindrodendrum hubeiense TaxID=595255 RepID=A0A9P5GV97_9HYPO|nr:hypothetical protein G7Z17_g12571 [Cylindrodendrum hubeiense]